MDPSAACHSGERSEDGAFRHSEERSDEESLILSQEDQGSLAPLAMTTGPAALGMTVGVELEARPGAENMAVDQTLLDLAEQGGQGFLRLYRWSPFCLSFGRHEPALRRYDRDRIESLRLDVVRRPTGGRAVWHARELTYAVAAPIAWFGSLTESYCAIHRLLAGALRSLGLPVTLAPTQRTAAVGSGACFASPAGGEILAAGRKLVGSAQLRQGSAFLQHGSLLLLDDQSTVARVTRGDAPPTDEITVTEALGRELSFREMADAIVESFAARFDLDSTAPVQSFSPAPDHLARFRDPVWTWRR